MEALGRSKLDIRKNFLTMRTIKHHDILLSVVVGASLLEDGEALLEMRILALDRGLD